VEWLLGRSRKRKRPEGLSPPRPWFHDAAATVPSQDVGATRPQPREAPQAEVQQQHVAAVELVTAPFLPEIAAACQVQRTRADGKWMDAHAPRACRREGIDRGSDVLRSHHRPCVPRVSETDDRSVTRNTAHSAIHEPPLVGCPSDRFGVRCRAAGR